uniref:cation:proton antiporter domain-containing protein n=1 Tax=Raoultella planticola TaxID=575 RepID=UPI0025ACBBB6|nr:cation:proton antiporter [Raoultella planticola]
MSLITIVLVFMMAIVVTVFISHLLPVKIPLPLLQIAVGAGLAAGGFQVDFDPHIFLLLFIPPLLFLDGWRIPKDAFFSDLKPILSLAIGLVLVTIIGIGWFIHWLIPAITVAAGFTLAAILSPTDPVAVSAVIVQGSSDVSLYNIKQSDLSVSVQGSGDVKLAGAVERLRIDIAGSGVVDR